MKSTHIPEENLFLFNVFAQSPGKHQVQIQPVRSPVTYLLFARL